MLSLSRHSSKNPAQFSFPFQNHRHHHAQSLRLAPPRSTTTDNTKTPTNNNNEEEEEPTLPPDSPITPPIPPGAVEIRFRRGSKRRRMQLEENSQPFKEKKKPPPKDWESMTFAEKAMEVYVGEKGLLFWLNKFAYASIFIIIGGWILFRFVGPALNLYQLDTPPLSPSSILKGS